MDASDRAVFHVFGGVRCHQEVATPLEPGTLYKWKVRYQDSDGVWSAWSRATLFMTNRAPERPVNQSPAEGATGVSLKPDLTASPYSDPDDTPQRASEWEIALPEKVMGHPVFLDVYQRVVEGEGHSHRVSDDLAAGTTYLWRVRYQDMGGLWSEWSERTSFVTTTTVAAPPPPASVMPSINVAAPNGGENLFVGYKHDVKWSTIGTPIVAVDIDYSNNGGNSWIPVAQGLPNSGAYLWIVPATPSQACLVRLTGRDSGGRVLATDQSNSVFSISVPPSASVSVFSPKQGAAWHIGASQRIEWTTSGQNIAYVNIYYTTDGGKSFRTIAEKVKNLGRYDWGVPKTPSQMARVRIFAVNAKGENLAMGESGAFLIIV
jgi:hypothetical protein